MLDDAGCLWQKNGCLWVSYKGKKDEKGWYDVCGHVSGLLSLVFKQNCQVPISTIVNSCILQMLLDLKDQIYRFLEQACWWAKGSWYCCVTNWMGYCLMIIYQWLGGYPEIANVFSICFAIFWNLRSSTSWPEESPHRGRRRSHIFRGMFDALGLDSSWWNYTPICTRMFVACMIFMFLPLRFKEKRHKVPQWTIYSG